ncbi:serine/threonine-protein kinase [Candidatus Contubernalis alkaliaceticus]|uniref:serine/threonine-protein kinase n=1 Tax=Candidatus Contubernalis alkaliaceticus TaxID=338645 RepID=UPI001F4C4C5B|nr:serine/threonine-protein kinase [Candidatus Contubernalis alkalaceticus]UNC91462.1 protein kinase [Candidatus Contubernalis alkalaceticus]
MDFHHLCLGCFEEKGDAPGCPHCGFVEGTPPESPVHLTPGTILNEKYLIGRALGQGGFGITYLSWDINLNLKLAIKEYYPQDLATRAAGHSQVSAYTGNLSSQYEYGLEKFLQEARTLAQFEGHPSIVSVRDFFKANETAYIVMSYIEGVTLKGYLKASDNQLPYDRVLAIMMPVLDALSEVHAVDILHRDISPDNIFINKKGQVILIDFGAARQSIGEKGRSLSIILKPGFTPEEQYRSKGIQGPWTDIYAAAATMYRVITGQMPPESLDRLEEDTLVPPSQLGLEIGEIQERALLKAMAVRSADRFQTVKEFQSALLGETSGHYEPLDSSKTAQEDSLEVQEVEGSSPPGKVGAKKSWKEKNSIPLIAAVVGGLLLLIFVFIFMNGKGHPPSQDAVSPGEQFPPIINDDGSENDKDEENIPGVQLEEKQGTIDYEGGQYTGQLLGESPHGEGVWLGPEGDEYEGTWKDGLPQGEGIWTGPDGESYQGDWEAGQKSGHGTFISANGVQYVGEWKNDRRNGQGTETWPNGSQYVGSWKDDLRHGQGTYTWPNGAQYVGQWREGWQHGEGTLTHPDGTVQSGNWVNNEFQD